MGLRAGTRLPVHLAGWTLVGVLAAVWPLFFYLWSLYAIVLVLFLVLDYLALEEVAGIDVERQVAGVEESRAFRDHVALALGAWTPVELVIVHRSSKEIGLEVFDHAPESAELEGLPGRLRLAAAPPAGEAAASLAYRLRPCQRGDVAFGRAEILVDSPRRLWRRRYRAGKEQQVRVLPNFKPVARYALLALADRRGQMGIRLVRRRGEGLDFRELREYREGDSERHVDWKATARRCQLISREYQEEKDQQIVLLLDCGRRMRALDGDLSHFDHVLNAVLLLTWVAVRQGDAVGLLTFSGAAERWLPPQKGQTAIASVLRSVYDLRTTLEPPDYLEAATRLLARQRRRCLVVLLTNLRDEDAGELLPALTLLGRRNLALVTSLRESATRRALALPPADFSEALLAAAAHRYLAARHDTHQALRSRGALTVDVEPDRLPIALVNRYLEVKSRGQL